MRDLNPKLQREFAVEVVRQLRSQGFEAYWAGGCVRDLLLDRVAKDFDVATNARPDEIRQVFSNRKTLAMGAAFGVITVLGPKTAGQVEVATFRQDLGYSDGRHPDRVAFSSAEEDAKRRDFTINGMFYDPLAERVIDFVGGQEDLKHSIVRAIGNPQARFTEDKLRMLRAVRFAAAPNFHLDEQTLAAIREMAPQVTVVSAERIADEMRRILTQPGRVRAVILLHTAGLLSEILPEAAAIAESEHWHSIFIEPGVNDAPLTPDTAPHLALLNALETISFPLAMAALLFGKDAAVADAIGQRWRLARSEIDRLAWLLKNCQALNEAAIRPWSQIQPLLIHDGARELLALYAAQVKIGNAITNDLEFCRRQFALPPEQLDPAPLIKGEDLIELQIPRGPQFAKLLQAVRDAQLDELVCDRNAALEFARKLHQQNEN